MNKEEAIKWLKDMKFEDDENCSENEALDIGIKAVELCEVWNGIHGQIVAVEGTFDRIWNDSDKEEQEPKTDSDCISREAVLKLFATHDGKYLYEAIRDMPHLEPDNCGNYVVMQEPKTEWIPVTEKLPKEGEEVLVWYEYFRYGDYNCMWQTYGIGWQYDGHFNVDNGGVKQRVIAWCPLPKEYKESEG